LRTPRLAKASAGGVSSTNDSRPPYKSEIDRENLRSVRARGQGFRCNLHAIGSRSHRGPDGGSAEKHTRARTAATRQYESTGGLNRGRVQRTRAYNRDAHGHGRRHRSSRSLLRKSGKDRRRSHGAQQAVHEVARIARRVPRFDPTGAWNQFGFRNERNCLKTKYLDDFGKAREGAYPDLDAVRRRAEGAHRHLRPHGHWQRKVIYASMIDATILPALASADTHCVCFQA
jgi:type II secretory pathway component PulJ